MDLLCSAYSTASDEEGEEPNPYSNPKPYLETVRSIPSSKRFKPSPSNSTVYNASKSEVAAVGSVPGRYVSKRERAAAASSSSSVSRVSDLSSPSTHSSAILSPVLGSISDSDIQHDVLLSLRHHKKGHAQSSVVPERFSVSLIHHMKAVNSIQWSPTHAHLLASAGMDHAICIWNVWSRDQKARLFNFHSAAVKDVRWSQHGLTLLSCGYDHLSRLTDVEKGTEIQTFKEDQVVGVIKFHPDNVNLFLSGGSRGLLRLWDIRAGKIVHEYTRNLGPILDIEFTADAKQFISSSDVSGGNLSENSIIVWDVSREVPLSNQVYVEAYTCPCIRSHPFDPYFVAQSNGNYIAIFSSNPPFKLDKCKRFEGHEVSGFPIKCNFSMDGERLISGSSDGSIYIYNYRSSKLIKKISSHEQACIDVALHPLMPNESPTIS
ncbi:WD40 repeat [Dillenia turbinata]|uniref:WD40 repeat n=1 Tax=Dillenia turbinata TaxID=194707 RepID=A0AAN8VG12_9MAGN